MRQETILMRGWEITIYRVYDRIIQGVMNVVHWPRTPYIKLKEAIMRQFEYYQDDEGMVKIRRKTGAGGVYNYIEGKLVKMSDEVEVSTIRDLGFAVPLRPSDAGYYDEELGMHIDSKKQYREEMKAQGLIPTESTRYCGNIKEKAKEKRAVDQRKITEKAFVEAHRKHGGGLDY